MPSNSGQRLPPTYYRGCWHVVSRGFLVRYRQSKGVPHPFFPDDRGLQPESLHPSRGVASSGLRPLGTIPACASRRGLGLVSVPVWPDTLSGRLAIVALVGRYPTNKLIARGPILRRPKPFSRSGCPLKDLCGISTPFEVLFPTRG
jgi:hypothetical protein